MGECDAHQTELIPPMMPLVAKSVPPLTRMASWLSPRVMRLVEQARSHRVTFVSGAEGYGKTTVLTEWYRRLREDGLNVVWFSCDKADVDVQRFWLNMHYAICSAFKNVGVPSCDTLDALPLPEAICTLANSLCLAAAEQGGLFIIIDRLDLLQGSPSMDILMMLVGALSDDVRLVFSSRRVYSKYHFADALRQDRPLSISTEDLALTQEETATVLHQVAGIQPSAQLVAEAYEKTRGWPFAVNLLAERMGVVEDPKQVVREFLGTDPHMWDFFQHEVFDILPSHLQEFLVKTSSLGVLNKRLCGYVLHEQNVDAYLSELLELNAFIFPLDASQQRYVRHPLFAEWLATAKMSQLPSVELRLLNGRAANWARRHNMPIAAAKHQILASEQDDIFDLVLVAYPYMTPQELLRLTHFHQSPNLTSTQTSFMLLAAWAYAYSADVDLMREWVRKVQEREGEGLSPEVALSLEVLQVKGLCLECCFDEGIQLAHQIEPKLKSPAYAPLRMVLTNCYAEALDHQGLLAQGMEKHIAFSSLSNSDASSFAFLSAINQYEMAYSYFQQGLFSKAEQVCKRIESSTTNDHPVRGAMLALQVLMDVVRGRGLQKGESLQKARQLVSRKRNADMYLDWSIAQAWAYVAEGDTDSADEVLLEAMNVVKESARAIPRGTSVLPFQSRAMLRYLHGDAKGAADVYVEFDLLGVLGTAHSLLVRQFVQLAALGEDNQEQQLQSLAEQAEEKGFKLLYIDIMLEIALCAQACGQRARATRLMHDILEDAAQAEIVGPFVWRAAAVRPLLASYLATMKSNYTRRSFAQRLLKRPEFSEGQNNEDVLESFGLTVREREILKLATKGLSRNEIAEELCVADTTVKSHLSHIYAKVGVNSFKDLLYMTSEFGL